MGKKRVTVLGSPEEAELKAKRAKQLEQKKLREGKTVEKPVAELPAPVETAALPAEAASESPLAPAKKTPKKIRVRSKSYKTAKDLIDSEKVYPLSEALDLLKKVNLTKFDSTVELHFTLKDKNFSREIELPFSTGKTRRVAVADDATVGQITAGTINFDVLVATPAQMAKLVKLAKILGPRGLMPNPKSGTVTENTAAAVKKFSSSQTVQLKTEKSAPLIHTVVGKLSQPKAELEANITALFGAVSGLSKKVVLKSTMSPAIKIQI